MATVLLSSSVPRSRSDEALLARGNDVRDVAESVRFDVEIRSYALGSVPSRPFISEVHSIARADGRHSVIDKKTKSSLSTHRHTWQSLQWSRRLPPCRAF